MVRNGAPFIERCLRSVLEQTWPHVEYIVLDGASTDGTQAIIERHRGRLAYYHSRPDSGPYDAQQQGFALATGSIVGLLHADDWLLPQACETLAGMHQAQPEAEIFCFGMREYRLQEDGTTVPVRVFCDPPATHFGLEDGLYCHGVNRFYRRETLLRHMPFGADRYPQMADRELYLRLGRIGLHKAWTDAVLYHFLVHPDSNSAGGDRRKKTAMLEETVRIAQDYLASPSPGLRPPSPSRRGKKKEGGIADETSFFSLSLESPHTPLSLEGEGRGEGGLSEEEKTSGGLVLLQHHPRRVVPATIQPPRRSHAHSAEPVRPPSRAHTEKPYLLYDAEGVPAYKFSVHTLYFLNAGSLLISTSCSANACAMFILSKGSRCSL